MVISFFSYNFYFKIGVGTSLVLFLFCLFMLFKDVYSDLQNLIMYNYFILTQNIQILWKKIFFNISKIINVLGMIFFIQIDI